ncbi:enoyl-CoA hydratase/isomerase family protein [Rhizobium pisi]|uniref:enoyl-CoA hydratase/isomerase family protein n=1 Tax=Rhizobium pisi TaxID=574561 RepID=UPI003D04B803
MKRLAFTVMLLSAVAFSSTAPAKAQQTATSATSSKVESSLFTVKVISPEIREITYANGPFNFIEPDTLVQLNDIVQRLAQESDVKVVVFDSGTAGFFYNHFDMGQFPAFVGQVGKSNKPLWVELISNVERAPFITIASIRGRTQGGGDELTLALDLRYASREKAIFNQPEVGIGLFPGGGGPDHLAKLTGRDRAIEAFLSADDYDAATAERYGWVTRAVPDAELDSVVMKMATRLATFDKQALIATKQHINSTTLPTESERLVSYNNFVQSLSWSGLQQRMGVFGKLMQDVGVEKVETQMGHYVGVGNENLQKSKK